MAHSDDVPREAWITDQDLDAYREWHDHEDRIWNLDAQEDVLEYDDASIAERKARDEEEIRAWWDQRRATYANMTRIERVQRQREEGRLRRTENAYQNWHSRLNWADPREAARLAEVVERFRDQYARAQCDTRGREGTSHRCVRLYRIAVKNYMDTSWSPPLPRRYYKYEAKDLVSGRTLHVWAWSREQARTQLGIPRWMLVRPEGEEMTHEERAQYKEYWMRQRPDRVR
jgi:hypothetical protein